MRSKMPGPRRRKPARVKAWDFWCGFTKGKPDVDSIADEDCVGSSTVQVVSLYVTRLEAEKRYSGVRKVRMTITEEQ